MRLAGQSKMGFYPAHPDVVKLIASHLQVNEKRPDLNTIVDPCMGKGVALKTMHEALGIPIGNVHGVELDDGRFAEAKSLMPDARLEGPASYYGVLCSPHVWSVAYVNPPFDDEIGGGAREEYRFLQKVYAQMSPDGILVFVCPLDTMLKEDVHLHIGSNYEDVRVYKFPDGEDSDGKPYRQFKEVVTIGKKRAVPLPKDSLLQHSAMHKAGCGDHYSRRHIKCEILPTVGSPWFSVGLERDKWGGFSSRVVVGDTEEGVAKYKLPSQHPPRMWKKWEATEKEIHHYLRTNPLDAKHLRSTPEPPIDRPPLPVGRGHCAVLLASGRLDGIVEEDEGGVHVVRGTAKKEEHFNEAKSKQTVNPATGEVRIVAVYSQNPMIVLRAVGSDGEIYTFTDASDAKAEDETPDVAVYAVEMAAGTSTVSGQEATATLDRAALVNEAIQVAEW